MSMKMSLSVEKIKTVKQFNNVFLYHNLRVKIKDNINIDLIGENIILTNINMDYDSYFQLKKEEIRENNLKNKTKNRSIIFGEPLSFSINIECKDLEKSLQINYLKEIDQTLKTYFKDQEIIQSIIHMDETTPHLHFVGSFFNKNLKKYNQGELAKSGYFQLGNYEKLELELQKINDKYLVEKRTTLMEKVEMLPLCGKKEFEAIQSQEINKYDKKKAVRNLLKKYMIAVGGDEYQHPKAVLLLENSSNKHIATQEIIQNIVNMVESGKTSELNGYLNGLISSYTAWTDQDLLKDRIEFLKDLESMILNDISKDTKINMKDIMKNMENNGTKLEIKDI